METAVTGALAHLDSLDEQHVAATDDLATLRGKLLKPLEGKGVPPDEVLSELIRDVQGGLIASAGGRFFGWVIGAALPAALGADWLTAAWDQNAALYATSPAAAIAEEVAGAWLKDILGLPSGSSFALVTGCQMAHFTCLAAARHRLLADRGWDVEQRGLFGAPPIRILTSSERHGSFERAVQYLGIGRNHITDLPVDSHGRLDPDALQHALETGDRSAPTLVLLQAGDVNIGAFDQFDVLVPLAKRFGAWVHVDGAFGLWAAASPRHRSLVDGVGDADSWATDGHKWLNVPFDCGYAFVADTEAHRASMSHLAPYFSLDASARDQMNWNPEWSRRARGFATYAALREMGRDGVANIIDRCCKHAQALVRGIGTLPGAEIVWEPVINQGLVRFLDPRPGATDQDHDRWTDEVIAGIVAGGEAFFGGTTWRGRRAMRISVSAWRTSAHDVERITQAVDSVLKSMSNRNAS